MGRLDAVNPQHKLSAGELAKLKVVVIPARFRLAFSLASMTGSGSTLGAAIPIVGINKTS